MQSQLVKTDLGLYNFELITKKEEYKKGDLSERCKIIRKLLQTSPWDKNANIKSFIDKKIKKLEKKQNDNEKVKKLVSFYNMLNASNKNELKKAYASFSNEDKGKYLKKYIKSASWNEKGHEYREKFITNKLPKIGKKEERKCLEKQMKLCKTYCADRDSVINLKPKNQTVYTYRLNDEKIGKSLKSLSYKLSEWHNRAFDMLCISQLRCSGFKHEKKKVIESYMLLGDTIATIRKLKDDKKLNFYVAKSEGEDGPIQGIAYTKEPKKKNITKLELLLSNPNNLDSSARPFSGAGTALVTHVAQEVLNKKREGIELINSTTSVKFYEKLGFKVKAVDHKTNEVDEMFLDSNAVKQLVQNKKDNHHLSNSNIKL